MPSSCCVPGCKSNYKSSEKVKVFQFPERGSPQFEKWMKKIPRKDWSPGNRSVVCILHFKEEQIIKEDRFRMPDGSLKIIPRQRFKLVDGAVPCIFPNLPSYLSSDPTTSRRCPNERQDELFVQHEQTIADFLNEDAIPSFETLVGNIEIFSKADDEELTPSVVESKELESKAVKLAEAGRVEEAIKIFNESIEISPKRPSPYNNRAQAYRLKGNISDASKDLNSAIDLSGGKGKSACLAYCQRALVHRLQGEQKQAVEDFKKAAELGSDFAKSQLVQMNPYAALCNQMLRKVMSQYQ